MPIKGLSDATRRLPRLGKFHLGVKVRDKSGKGEHPQATDYFVVPEELKKFLPDKPTELPIMIPTDDDEIWCPQYFKRYSSRGLTCRGDGYTCRRMVDSDTGDMADRNTKEIAWKENLTCAGKECPWYIAKECKETMNLQFLMPDLPGLGVWQIDTSSTNSIRNINNTAALLREATPTKRISFIPLLLTIEPKEIISPDDGKKKTVRVLNLRSRATLRELMVQAGQPVAELLLPAPADDEAPLDDQVEAVVIEASVVDMTMGRTGPDIVQSGKAAKDIKELWPMPSYNKATELAEKHKDNPVTETPPGPEQELDFDPEELKDTLRNILHFKVWSDKNEKTVQSWLQNVLGLKTKGTTIEMVTALPREDREALFKKIADLSSMA